MDFLLQYGAKLDLKSCHCYLSDKKLPLICVGGGTEVRRVVVAEELIIPAHSEALVHVKVEGMLWSKAEGMVEPDGRYLECNNLLMARVE